MIHSQRSAAGTDLAVRLGGLAAWRVGPTADFESTRADVEGTMALRTEFRTFTGAVAVTDVLPFLPLERGHGIGQRAPHAIVRLVEGLDGEVETESEVVPRPEYGLTVPRWEPTSGGAVCRGGAHAYVLSCPPGVDVREATATARFTVRRGDRVGLAVRVADAWESTLAPWSTDQVRAWLHGTVRGWQSWSRLHQRYDEPWAEVIHHSGRVLQALTYAPTGAVIAAPTTSLPESVSGDRNRDYRYGWVRDASLTVAALWVAACPDEVGEFFRFFVTAAGAGVEGGDALQILYRVTGERRVEEHEFDHLAGYRRSRPVRVGNAAWRQSQLDVYGELLDAAAVYADRVARVPAIADRHVVRNVCHLPDSRVSSPTAAGTSGGTEQKERRWHRPRISTRPLRRPPGGPVRRSSARSAASWPRW